MEKRELEKVNPILDYEELMRFNGCFQGVSWREIIPRQATRGEVRYYNNNCTEIEPECTIIKNKQKILVCHDMMGNYREDSYYKNSHKWDDYRFYHWAGIDYFCYFSHNFITIPPPVWTSAAHRHGVAVLGTFITEDFVPHKCLSAILKSPETIQNTCKILVDICEFYCFEGYLINIESPVIETQIPDLKMFIKVLTEETHRRIPNGFILWYDSVIEEGILRWQNELNDLNRNFFSLCDGIFLNYNWSEEHLNRTKTIIDNYYPGDEKKVFCGIDVFGRGQVGQLDTRKTLASTIPYNFSVAIFATGWTFESMTKFNLNVNEPMGCDVLNERFLEFNELFWHYIYNYIGIHVYEKTPFYSNFCLGSGKNQFEMGHPVKGKFFNLSEQSYQPSVPLLLNKRNFDDAVDGGSCLEFVHSCWTRIFATDFAVEKTFIFGFASKSNCSQLVDCVILAHEPKSTSWCQVICGQEDTFSFGNGNIQLPPIKDEEVVIKLLKEMGQDMKLPFTLQNGWIVRYYALSFDKPIIVKDIGAGVNGLQSEKDSCSLGAVYFHAGNAVEDTIPIIKTENCLVNINEIRKLPAGVENFEKIEQYLVTKYQEP